ncbi:hypothetical protein Desaci_2537 [Desulfosporosinus acidiphilus SJ4]|uniref:Uncharacterized protein n=1 Tax=Desulfosporosinus acidiphilus (strain DSM 22704 / JCM 16185 / SJ4) TaxID=646529 RepID=I4D6Q5_DESAJ|nr:hypothetical protein [Desulfosporosinus acidiphilus]AFM41479.1 hypothetical protein Desaci_2537 [Desulfosporosinus acidiphilus SJ4]
MESIILVGNKNLELSVIERMEHNNCIRKYYSNIWFVVEYADSRVYYHIEPELIKEYEVELKVIPFKQPQFMLVDYISLGILKNLILTEYSMKNTWIDNNHGIILPIQDFITLLKQNPSWDWR